MVPLQVKQRLTSICYSLRIHRTLHRRVDNGHYIDGGLVLEDMSFAQWLVGQTGITGVAMLSIWIAKMMNEQAVQRRAEDMARELKRHEDAIMRERENAEVHREDKRLLLEVVKANTEGNAKLATIISAFDKHIYPSVNRER